MELIAYIFNEFLFQEVASDQVSFYKYSYKNYYFYSLTESATEPMKNQLLQIESNIQEYQDMIDASRVKILQNNEKILKMLTI